MNVSLFLGAGASVPYEFPTTQEFKQKLANISESETLQWWIKNSNYQDVEHILSAMEDVIEFSDTLGSKFFENSSSFSYQNSTNYTYKEILDHVRKDYTMIKKQVYKLYKWDEKKESLLKENLSPVFKLLKTSQNGIHVFTTNYDQSVEEYVNSVEGVQYFDGFPYNADIRKSIFNKKQFKSRQNRINLYKLHGSLNWKKDQKHGVVKAGIEERKEEESENLIVYPSLSPKCKAEEEPFKTLLRIFKSKAEDMDCIIVIGYSFRDEHINEIFKDFLSNPSKRIMIISPTAKQDWRENFMGNNEYKDTNVSLKMLPEYINRSHA